MFEKTTLAGRVNAQNLSDTKHDALVHSLVNDVRGAVDQEPFRREGSVQDKIWDGYGWIHAPVPHEQSPPSYDKDSATMHFERFIRIITGGYDHGYGDGMDGLVIPQRPKNTPPQSSSCVVP